MTFPAMNDAFWGWSSPVVFQLVNKQIVNFEAVESPVIQTTFEGVLEPVHSRALLVKPEGQRNWKWWSLWTTQELQNGDICQDESGKQYRVMNAQDWSNGGYRSYELVQDPPLEN